MNGLDTFRDCTREGHPTITVSNHPGLKQCISCQGYFRRGPDGTLTPAEGPMDPQDGPGRPESPPGASPATQGRKRAAQRRTEEP